MSILENVDVKPASPKAKVVVNARTGTIVIGGDVRVTPAAVSHGSLTVKVQNHQQQHLEQQLQLKMLTRLSQTKQKQ